MLNYLNSLVSWAPSLYYTLNATKALFSPSHKKWQKTPSKKAPLSPRDQIVEKVIAQFMIHKTTGQSGQDLDKLHSREIKKNVHLYQTPHIQLTKVLEKELGTDQVISFNIGLEETNKDAFAWMCKFGVAHSLSHEKRFSSGLAAALAALSTNLIPLLQPFLPWWSSPFLSFGLPSLVGVSTHSFACIFERTNADDAATTSATDQELLGADVFLDAILQANRKLREKVPNGAPLEKIVYPLESDDQMTCDFRLNNIKQEIKKRDLTVPKEEQLQKIENMKAFILRKALKIYLKRGLVRPHNGESKRA